MLKPIVAAVSVAVVVGGGAYAWGVHQTKSQYNQKVDALLSSPMIAEHVVVERSVIEEGFFGQVERVEIKPHPSLNLDASLAYENHVSFSFAEAEGAFELDTKYGVVGQQIGNGVISGLTHTGKWKWDGQLQVSHKTPSFKIDSKDVDVSVSPFEHAFFVNAEDGNGEYRMVFGGMVMVEKDRSRLHLGSVRSEGFVQTSKSGNITIPQQNTSIAMADFRHGDEALMIEDLVFSLQELEDDGFVTINQDLSVAKIQADTSRGDHDVSDIRIDVSLRHLDRDGYDLFRAVTNVQNPNMKQRQAKQAVEMMAQEGMALDISDISLALNGHRSGIKGTLSLKPVNLQSINRPEELVPYMGGNMALTFHSSLVDLDPSFRQLVRQGISAGILTLDKDGNPAMFAELNSGQLLVNGRPLL